MKGEIVRNLDKEKLITFINTLRDVLNEICCTIDETEQSIEI